jgi:hypothetical protein
MKKMKKLVIVAMMSLMLVVPALTGSNATHAEDGVNPGQVISVIEIVKDLAEAIEDLFCPENPQNRCKNGVCQSGACISFRPSCNNLGSGC